MPLYGDIHVFASHKGGTGKTQLCFQIASQFANAHPEVNVLVMDFTELGDLTKRCLGGYLHGKSSGVVSNSGSSSSSVGLGTTTAVPVDIFGGMFDLIGQASAVVKQEEQAQQGGLFQKFAGFLRGKAECSVYDSAMCPKLAGLNDHLSQNFYLLSSGASCREDDWHRTPAETIQLANTIRESLESGQRTQSEALLDAGGGRVGSANSGNKLWKVFLDTDGDRRPAPATRLAYALADFCIIPIQADESDFQRLEPMFEYLNYSLETEKSTHCRIQLILWNKLQVYKREPGELGTFQVPKVSHEMIQSLNRRLHTFATKVYPNLFVHNNYKDVDEQGAPTEAGTKSPAVQQFTKAATALVGSFPDSCALLANALGVPYCKMSAGKFALNSGVTFTTGKPQIDGCVENITEILGKLETMEL